jgi:hypothetical protein
MRPFYNEEQVQVEGDTLHLVLNFRALDVIESLTGQKMSEILPQLIDPPHALVGKMLWGLLREKHESVSLDEAAGAAFGPDGAKIGLAMAALVTRAFNLGGDEGKKKNPRKPRGTSKAS